MLSAVGHTGQFPAGFKSGALIALFKKGDLADAANYRPITLLNTDYRLLTKVLAARVGPVLANVISPEQSAFLPDRIIGDNIMFLQLLPACLRAEGRSAVVAFLDFVKAYDTVNREFLFAVMAAMGAGVGFLKWARLLLSDTTFVAVVNGFVSDPVLSAEGVRQGCPLAPLLYLFVAQALQCFLRMASHTATSGIGILLAGALRCSSHYADDTQVLLRSLAPACVEHFVSTMHVFGLASGQRLNLPKCELLQVGDPSAIASAPNGTATSVAGIKVVAAATSLGLRYSNAVPAAADQPGAAGPAEVDWPQRVADKDRCYSKLAKLSLSTFGRAFAASGYGISKLLYHAEYAGMPPAVIAALHKTTTKLVDRAQAPHCSKRALPGVPSDLLPGHPSVGGFGCLPWTQHINSRHAVWGARLTLALAAGLTERSPMWHHLALALLTLTAGGAPGSAVQPVIPPALVLLAASPANHFKPVATAPALPPGPLQRMAVGLRAMHPDGLQPLDVAVEPWAPGAWCMDAPLWGNPLLPCPPMPAAGVVGGPGSVLDDGFGQLQALPTLRTVRDLFRIRAHVHAAITSPTVQAALAACRFDKARQLYMQQVWEPELASVGLCTSRMAPYVRLVVEDRGDLAVRLDALFAALPVAWRASLAVPAPPAAPPAADTSAFIPTLVDRLGWRFPPLLTAAADSVGVPLRLKSLVVKTGTMLQLGAAMTQRRSAHSVYVAQALHLAPGAAVAPAFVQKLAATLRDAWRLKWENVEKEAFWRLAVDGVRGANTRVQPFKCLCGCGAVEAAEARAHAFWDCPVATAIRGTIEAALQPHAPTVSRASVWLSQPPPQIKEVGVWLVVCLAAISAMDHGRRQLWRLYKAAEQRSKAAAAAAQQTAALHRHTTLTGLWRVSACPAAAPLVARASALAVANFWGRLASFTALRLPPDSWRKSLKHQHQHPFLRFGVAGLEVHMGCAGPVVAGGAAGSEGGDSDVGSAAIVGTVGGAGALALNASVPDSVAVAAPSQVVPAALGASASRSRPMRQPTLAHLCAPRARVPPAAAASAPAVAPLAAAYAARAVVPHPGTEAPRRMRQLTLLAAWPQRGRVVAVPAAAPATP